VKNLLCIFAFAFLFYIQNVKAVEFIRKDTVVLAAVSFDSTLYKEFQTQKNFNYYSQKPDEPNAWRRLQEKVYLWLTEHLAPALTSKQFNIILIIALIAVLVLAIIFLFVYKPSLFYINRELNYQINEEDIERTNFEKQIRNAIEKGEYQEAIRWNYLKILKTLNERGIISFGSNKTVNEYVYEMKRKDLKPDFKNISMQFIYYRYGNGEASRETFDKFKISGDKILLSL
jgi:hypothetical protein